jgi:NAD-dependent dihydropyrimidine dehydrogenase PreA subunit
MAENIVLFCNCQARHRTLAWTEASELLRVSRDIHVVTLTDLCGWCVQDPGQIKELTTRAEKILMVACHPRAVRLLLNQSGIDQPEKIRFFNLLEQKPGDLIPLLDDYWNDKGQPAEQLQLSDGPKVECREPAEQLPLPGENQDNGGQPAELVADPTWPAWYPVIDYGRCNGCGQCAEFCLFGVYRKTGGKVLVVNPASCKNNCPACARICPQIAIIFPKYLQGGVIGGADTVDETAEIRRLQHDTDAILGSDIYQALENRKMKRRKIIRADAMEQAIRDRDEALGFGAAGMKDNQPKT